MAAMLKLVILTFVFLYIDYCKSDNLVLGSSTNAQLAYVQSVKLAAVPLKTRTKNVFYNGNQIIKALSAIDMAGTKGKATVTSGGIGFTFANIKLKSERGDELNYQIQIFV